MTARASLFARARRAWQELRGKATPAAREVFTGAAFNRLLMDWVASCLRPDEEIRWNLRLLRARARDLYRNSSTIRHYLRLLTMNVIGHRGARLHPQVRLASGELDKVTNTKIRILWDRWAGGKVTVDGRLNLLQLQHLALRTVAMDGEIYVRFFLNAPNPYGFALQLIDADLVDETYNVEGAPGRNEVRMGVEVDALGAPLAYWVNQEPRSFAGAPIRRYRVPASEMLHLYRPDRPNQTRGITWLHPVMVTLKMLSGYIEAELVAARIAAAKMGFFTSSPNEVPGEIGSEPGQPPPSMDANPGTAEALPIGWQFTAWDPQHPTTAFPDFTKDIRRDLASGLGVSYNALANDLEGVNYSSMRSGLLVERDEWQVLHEWWNEAFLEPTYAGFMSMALLTGALPLASRDYRRYIDATWVPRGWSWVDPLKDVQASALAIDRGFTSPQRVVAEQGEDFEEILEEIATAMKLAKAAGVPIVRDIAAAPADDPEDTTPPAKKNGTARTAHRLIPS